MLILLVACSWGDPAPAPPSETPAAPQDPVPAEPVLGVSEVVTPPGIVRATEVEDNAGAVRLDIWFDAAHTTYDALGQRLDGWGFTRVDGDGESWRVVPPPGREWEHRLEPLPDVWKVQEALEVVPLPSGAVREGQERYGALLRTWSWRESGPIDTVTGAPTPPAPALPQALPAWAVACLTPAVEQLSQGLGRGIGWERAWRESPSTWVLVLENHGACQATGWLPLAPDAAMDALTVAGKPVADVATADVHATAGRVLAMPMADGDPAAEVAVALLADAPDDVKGAVLDAAAPGAAADSLARSWLDASPDAALAWARSSTSVTARALLVSQDPNDRAAALSDPAAPPHVVLAALNAWRPSQNEGADVLSRLRASPDPRVRARAHERTIDAEADACRARIPSLASADAEAASAAWRACPHPQVRDAVFERLRTTAPDKAATLVAEVMERPETVTAGVAAVRQAELLGRFDLLKDLVTRRTVVRAVRREALARLVAANQPGASALVEAHAAYVGFVPPAAPATVQEAP